MFADGSKRGTQIDRGCCFADPALLVGDRQHARTGASGRTACFAKGTTKGSTGCSVIGSGHFAIPEVLDALLHKPLKSLSK